MSLVETINNDIKSAMLAKEADKLAALRAAKSALLLAATAEGAGGEISDEEATKVIQKQVKQRKDAANIYTDQGRDDLAKEELDQAAILEVYLPEQMDEDELRTAVSEIIQQVGASSPADMGKVMGPAMGKLGSKAAGKLISQVVKELLA